MNLETYQELTGITVSEADTPLVTAQLRRTRKILEGLLGYSLNTKIAKKNLYIERGKTDNDCSCPNVEPETLEDPDEVEYAYRLFPYNHVDKYLHVDPFTALHSVKLVRDDVTYKTFDDDDLRASYGSGWSKYIENCKKLCACMVECDCVQLAVDAQWLDLCKYDEVMYIWADMVTYYADCKRDIKSESIGSHSYTRFADAEAGREGRRLGPEDQAFNVSILKKYAGPHGTLTKVIV